jgi:hypothetical protein
MRMSRTVYRVATILRLQRSMADEALLHLSQAVMDRESIRTLVALWRAQLGPRVRRSVLLASLTDLPGRTMTAELASATAWRLAGNLELLCDGQPAVLWVSQPVPQWLPARIVSVRRAIAVVADRNKHGAWISLRLEAGYPAGRIIRRFWSSSFVAHQRLLLGFHRPSRRPDKWPANKPFVCYEDIRQVHGFTLSLLVTPLSCRYGADGAIIPGFEKMAVTAAQRKQNRELLFRRVRHEFTCPFGYTHVCHRCPVGNDRCAVAAHERTYVGRSCPGCKKRAAFDPADTAALCLTCQARALPVCRSKK